MSWRNILPRVAVLKYFVVASPLAFCSKSNVPTQDAVARKHIMPRQKFVIVGLGTAGAAAMREILKHGHDTDKVLIIDPHARLKLQYSGLPMDPRISLAEQCVTDIDHVHHILRLSNGAKVSFEKCLIAVGSAPPMLNPMYVDPACDVAVTVVDLTHLNAPYELYTTITGSETPSKFNNCSTPPKTVLPGNIALLGANCWETVHLAGKLAISGQHHDYVYTAPPQLSSKESSSANGSASVTNSANGRSAAPVTLIYPAYGPMSHSLPRYLSLALARRLTQTGVNLMPYTHVRYLDADGPTTHDVPNQSAPSVVLYTAKTYDSLNTQSMKFQKIAFAPTAVPTHADAKEYYTTLHAADMVTTVGIAGSEAVAHNSKGNAELSDAEPVISTPQRRLHVHDFLLRSGLEIERQSGGIAVNQSLQACEGIYAAGDIASVYTGSNRTSCVDLSENAAGSDTQRQIGESNHNGRSVQQRGTVRGYANAAYSGSVAGRNMVVSAHRHGEESAPKSLHYTHTPVYHAISEEMGVYFTFIGNCSSALESHGFWWRLGEHNNVASNTQNKARKAVKPTVASEDDSIKPPLGLGVVFYAEDGVVAGVLVSGLRPAGSISDAADSVVNVEEGAHRQKTYSDCVQEIATSLVGQSVQKLGDYSHEMSRLNNSANDKSSSSRGEIDKLMFEVDVGAEAADDRPITTTLPSLEQHQPAASSHDSGVGVADNRSMGDSAALLQALSLEARRVISPVLSAHLYEYSDKSAQKHRIEHHTPEADITIAPAVSKQQNMKKRAEQLYDALQSYPRPLYRYGSASHTTHKDLSESVARSVIRPVQLREALFQPENVNTGSKTDNLYAAFKKKLVHGNDN